MEPRGVHRRVPRGAAHDRRGQGQRRGDRGRRSRAHREGRRPDGGAEGERRRCEEAVRRRARAQAHRFGQEGAREEDRCEEDGREEEHGQEVDREEGPRAQEGCRGVTHAPPPGPGRPATRYDLDAIVALFHARDSRTTDQPESAHEYLTWIWDMSYVDLARDSRLLPGSEVPDAFAQLVCDPDGGPPQLDWSVHPRLDLGSTAATVF